MGIQLLVFDPSIHSDHYSRKIFGSHFRLEDYVPITSSRLSKALSPIPLDYYPCMSLLV